jgi:hypothetical protein
MANHCLDDVLFVLVAAAARQISPSGLDGAGYP